MERVPLEGIDGESVMHPLQGHVTDIPDTVGYGDDERIDLTGIEIDVARIKNNKNISSLSNFQNRKSVKTVL